MPKLHDAATIVAPHDLHRDRSGAQDARTWRGESLRPAGASRAQPSSMLSFETAATDLAGRVAYIEPAKQWGYLHGAAGERVYFHATVVLGGIATLAPGDTVCYRLAGGGDRPSAAWVRR